MISPSTRIVPFFLGARSGRIFCIRYRPQVEPARGPVVMFVPPFGEEMNKSRRILHLQAKDLGSKGIVSWLPDLYGTGDSEGEFREATWEKWLQDVEDVLAEIVAQENREVWFIATRLGCALAQHFLDRSGMQISGVILWQPVISGKKYISQLLRIRLIQEKQSGAANANTAVIRERLRSDKILEIGGYELNHNLFAKIEQIDMVKRSWSGVRDVFVVEVSSDPDSPPALDSNRAMKNWTSQGYNVHSMKVQGAPFYGASEIVVNHDLIAATTRFVQDAAQDEP